MYLTATIDILHISVSIALIVIVLCLVIGGITITRKATGKRRKYDLARNPNNPIISPRARHEWEAEGAFNPTAVTDDHGLIHLFYRAMGRDGLSRIGHAVTKDGKHISGQSSFPVYEPRPGLGMPEASEANKPHHHDYVAHPSGGGWGGAEDPRVTRIGDRVYMTYTAFEGWDNMRIGLTSISVKDMENSRWNWRNPHLISSAKARSKNWVIFPEKINGKYAILHSVAPRPMIAYLDTLDAVPEITSSPDHGGYGYEEKDRKDYWDHTTKGAGPSPIRTRLGWLVLYHATGNGKYKVGAMILDIHDPTRILYRAPEPILTPEMPYENDGKPGIVYATGAVIKDDNLLVYYGGGDKHTCVAETPLEPLLGWLVKYGKV